MSAQRVISHAAAVRAAAQYFLRRGTVDVDELAAALSVSRATLYRVVGSRELLLGHTLWALCEIRLDAARRARTRDGIEGVLDVTRHFAAGLTDAKGLIRFVTAETELADRVMYSVSGVVHPRVVATQKEIFLEAGWRPGPGPAVDLDRLAYLYTRMAEAALYAELLFAQQHELGAAEKALRALLTDAWPGG
jgi:AcrR family transcriptional regulator